MLCVRSPFFRSLKKDQSFCVISATRQKQRLIAVILCLEITVFIMRCFCDALLCTDDHAEEVGATAAAARGVDGAAPGGVGGGGGGAAGAGRGGAPRTGRGRARGRGAQGPGIARPDRIPEHAKRGLCPVFISVHGCQLCARAPNAWCSFSLNVVKRSVY